MSLYEPVDPAKFLPKDSKAYTKDPSPSPLESVIWTVFKEPVQISKEQLSAMRDMKCRCKEDKDLAMVDNYRPLSSTGKTELSGSHKKGHHNCVLGLPNSPVKHSNDHVM